MSTKTIYECFPKTFYQKESDYKSLYDSIRYMITCEDYQDQETKDRIYILDNKDTLNINIILANFIDAIGSFLSQGDNEINFIREVIMVVNMLRRLLNERGNEDVKEESSRELPEYCNDKHNKINKLVNFIDLFFNETFPCYMSDILE